MKAKTFADEEQITLFGPVSIEKICLVEGQVKDTSPVSITTVTFKNQGTQRALYLYKVPNFMQLSMWESATQNSYHAESNPTQLNSMELAQLNGARRRRGPNNDGGSIQGPSPPPTQKNRKNISKG